MGEIHQRPPMVSAVKVGGRRLHELARQGVEVEREARPVTVRRFDVEPTDDPLVYRVAVDCSSGTYVRAWPPTSAGPWAAAPTCGTCGGSPWARSRVAEARPLDEASRC